MTAPQAPPAPTPEAPRLGTAVDPADPRAVENDAAHRALVADLRDRLERTRLGGPERSRARHVERGKLLPRDRVDALVDPSSPFLELSPLAAHGMYDDQAPGAGMITGVGRVAGREVVVVANDATVKGGTYYPMTVKKHLRAQEVALHNRLPCVYLVDSGARTCPSRTRCSPTASTSAASSTTRRRCPARASRRSPPSSGPAPRVAPTSPR